MDAVACSRTGCGADVLCVRALLAGPLLFLSHPRQDKRVFKAGAVSRLGPYCTW